MEQIMIISREVKNNISGEFCIFKVKIIESYLYFSEKIT
ncbi:hypothetical protein SAMN05421866_3227 [Chryseobacterium oranimense]|jgi:hypothetical protein|uniref:Uncharacterized protein n=1 Tax=Chryseobacterium oranimense TaxID=421058 RepID=A0A1M5UHG8_9FLAO|nr:hypothetical protein BN1195_01943 [Chryseobacterium oranimense G311]SHH62266.1 hypothetical protein SAMN05421866_3227 [Chryseobacterium oranimense]